MIHEMIDLIFGTQHFGSRVICDLMQWWIKVHLALSWRRMKKKKRPKSISVLFSLCSGFHLIFFIVCVGSVFWVQVKLVS